MKTVLMERLQNGLLVDEQSLHEAESEHWYFTCPSTLKASIIMVTHFGLQWLAQEQLELAKIEHGWMQPSPNLPKSKANLPRQVTKSGHHVSE